MHYYTTDLKHETVMARNIQHVNAVASAAIGLGIAVEARGLARGRIGQDPPRHGWRMQDESSHGWPYQLRSLDVFGGVWGTELEARVGFLVQLFMPYGWDLMVEH